VQRLIRSLRSLIDLGLVVLLLYWMMVTGVLGLWNVGAAPGWCIAYLVGLASHVVLLRAPTRTRSSFEAWVLAGLVTLPVVLWMGRERWPFAIDRASGWNTVLDDGEVNWCLWPYLQLIVWWPAWNVTRAIRWPASPSRARRTTTTE
jgi:hypothetical protein